MIRMKLRKYMLPMIFVVALVIIFFIKGYEVKPVVESTGKTSFTVEESKEVIQVYITGEVLNPGVYVMDPKDRLNDLIDKAGGFTDHANRSINLARPLKDGEMIVVYKASDESSDPIYIGVDIFNYSNQETLMAIDGIGETIAKRIIAYRNEKGHFSSIEDLLNVEGIGEKKLQLIQSSLNN